MSDVAPRLSSALADRYRIERELGAGGMATVYLAHDLKHQRDVAIKVLHPDLGAALGGKRFLSEIRTTARLQHPHILPLLDSGDAEGLLYYVMPYVSGETLRARLDRERQLPVDDAVRIASEVADALGSAHALGIIHRDIKPENILLQNGHAIVADFGIALAVQSAGGARMTQTGLSLGTPSYMSPEQAMGERVIDARSDIYALGAVMYEMLTGEPPFVGPTVQAIVAKVVSAEPQRPTLVRASIGPAIEQAVLRALAKLPADRFATAAAFGEALRQAPTIAPGVATLVASRRARIDWRVALVAGLAAGAIATMFVAARRTSGKARTDFMRSQVTFTGRTGLPAITANGDVLAYVSMKCEQLGHDGFVLPYAEAADPVPCLASLVVQDSGATAPVAVLTDVPGITGVRWTANGTSLIVAARLDSVREGLFIIPRLGGAPRQIGGVGIFDTHPAGDTVLLARGTQGKTQNLALIATATGAVVDSIPLASRVVSAIAWSPDGRHIALSGPGMLHIVRRRDGSAVDSLPVMGFRETLRWTPGGDGILAFHSAPARDDAFIRLPITRDGHVAGAPVEIMPRMQMLYLGHFDVARRTGHIMLASGDAIQDQWTFDVAPGTIRGARQITNGTTWYDFASIAPDGSALSYARGDALGDNIYRVATTSAAAEEAITTQRGYAMSNGTHLSADGRRTMLATMEPDGRAVVRDVDLTTRQARTVALPYPLNSWWRGVPFGANGFVDRQDSGTGLMIRGAQGGAVQKLAAPDSMRVIGHTVSPDGRSIAVLVATGGTTVLGIVPMERWDFRLVARLGKPPFITTLSWSKDGGIYFADWVAGGDAPALFRAPVDGGAGVSRVMTLPARCWVQSVVVAVGSPKAACQTHDWRSDIFLARVPGVTQ